MANSSRPTDGRICGEQGFDVLDNVPLLIRRKLLRNRVVASNNQNVVAKESQMYDSQYTQKGLPRVKDSESLKMSMRPLEVDRSLETWSGDSYEIPSVVWQEMLYLAKERTISYYAAKTLPFVKSESNQTSMSTDNVVGKEHEDHSMQKLLPAIKDNESLKMSSSSINKCESGSEKLLSSNLDHVPLTVRRLTLLEAKACSFWPTPVDIKKEDGDRRLQAGYVRAGEGLTQQLAGQQIAEIHPADGQYSLVKNQLDDSVTSTSVRVKAEPLDGDTDVLEMNSASHSNLLPIKREPETCNEFSEDCKDHFLLQNRCKLLASGRDSELKTSRSFVCSEKIETSATECNRFPEFANSFSISHPRRKRRNATDSVKTAMEEDAPGLLQALIEKGVSVDEIRLYGFEENDDPVDEYLGEESFTDSESVMPKLLSEHEPFFKFAPLRLARGSKPSYCFPCLLSLIEQARLLLSRSWPAEWGWSRDLQSFIFVFQRHNRIVLERPEYGYATYFFELHGSQQIDWQIKRLVTAMKVISRSRISLIENKALLVGEDISENQARILAEFGWTPNTGLGTMLHFYDRVVHDRKNEKDSSEWKSKIANMLVDGLQGGAIVSTSILDNVKVESEDDQGPEVKLEI